MGLVRCAAGLVLACSLAGVAGADDLRTPDSLAVARELYSAAEYESALGMLDRLRSAAPAGDGVAPIEQYRAFCLLALGRPADAEQAIAAVVIADPTFTLTDPGLSPRLRAAFRDVRARTLPQVIRQQYDTAKAAFDRREFAAAAVGFSGVTRMLADPDVAPQAGSAPLSDIGKLAAGFRDLSIAAAAPPPPLPSAAPPEIVVPEPAAPQIFGADDADVVPPVAERQTLPPFQMPAAAAAPGVLDVLVDERGLVQSATMRVSINPRYDRLVLDAARTWKYQPATRAGVPVRYRKLVQIVVKAER
jgi:hypothetical protein